MRPGTAAAAALAAWLLAAPLAHAQDPPPAPADAPPTPTEAPPETADVLPNPLEELAWFVGDWIDRDDEATVESSTAWTRNGRFLRRMFHITPASGPVHSGMQLIGWDPADHTIRSWTFDEDGGFGEERWTRSGDQWSLRSRYTLPDGEHASAIHVIRRLNDDTFTWKSVNRVIGGSLQPDIEEVVVVRAPVEAPTPEAPTPPADEPATDTTPSEPGRQP
jgi:hypothetical protein